MNVGEHRRRLPVALYGDATGEARSTSSKPDYELTRIYFRSNRQFTLDLDIPRVDPPVRLGELGQRHTQECRRRHANPHSPGLPRTHNRFPGRHLYRLLCQARN